jgi:homoserine kinase
VTSPRPGVAVRVTVPATSANLGPGFDALGLALDLHDRYELRVAAGPGVEVVTQGAGADCLPDDETHLVARSVRAGLSAAGHEGLGFSLTCHNRIPQGRGMGSSAAAIVGGLALAGALTGHLERQELLRLATEIEGHPDNVAAAALGRLTISWRTGDGASATCLPVHRRVALVLFVPEQTSPTVTARAALPATVPHADAAFNAGRAALLVAALTRSPELLLPATEDRLHQDQRRTTYPEAMALVDRLRGAGWAAVVSGAGPAVLVLTTMDRAQAASEETAPGYRATRVGVGAGVLATRLAAHHS